ncbi:MAG: T9SS type A sorting domain-containing protein [Saprospiraceae bacterium]|nr:T9SS type A sorting domain-containing protein [Saprospiraceae bacterium]
MKKSLLLFLMLIAACFVQAQNTVNISGTITYPNGDPVEGVDVHIVTDSSAVSNFFYFNTVTTDANGGYADAFDVPAEITQGLYYLSLQDCNGSGYLYATVGFNPGNYDAVVDFDYCANCEATIDANPSGALVANSSGVGPFSYAWNTGEATQSIFPTQEGEYCVEITDAGGCAATACYTYSTTQDSCGVDISITAAGGLGALGFGVPPFTYSWSNGSTSAVIFPSQTGTYCVTMTDSQGCVAESCFFFDNGNPNDTSCYVQLNLVQNGTVLQATAGGTAPFTYSWSTGQTGSVISLDMSGLYCVTVVDATGCVATSCYSHNDNPQDSLCSAFITCPIGGGILQANASGEAPFTYEWNTGETTADIMPTQTGNYCVTITDNTGCMAEACIYHIEDGGGQDSCSLFISQTVVGTSVQLEANAGGEAPFAYSWGTGETTAVIEVSETGQYCVTVTDANGCISLACVFVSAIDNYDIGGIIYLQDSLNQELINGWVYLYELTTLGTELVDSVEFASAPSGLAYYLFEDVPQGDYITKAELNPGSFGYDDYAPSYHFSTIWWNEADVISVPNGSTGDFDHIVLVPEDGFNGGDGEINGLVEELDGFIVNDPMANVSVMLMSTSNTLLAHRKTSAQGTFKFSGLDWGTYKVGIEVTGMDQVFYLVTLSPDNPTVANILFEVSNDGVMVTETLEQILTSGIRLAPNPVADQLQIELNLLEASDLQVELMHASGQLIRLENVRLGAGEQRISWDTAELPAGLYFINVKKGQEVMSKKLIKK